MRSLVFLSFMFSFNLSAQFDSIVCFWNSNKLVPMYYFASKVDSTTYLVEDYFLWKGNYWIGHENRLTKSELEVKTLKMDKKVLFACDTLVNKVRNDAFLHKKTSEIRAYMNYKIGYRNDIEFNEFDEKIQIMIPKCHDDFKIKIESLTTNCKFKVDSIYQSRQVFLNELKNEQDLVGNDLIEQFVTTMSNKVFDYQILEQLVLKHGRRLLSVTEKIDENRFNHFVWSLSSFPTSIDITKMKKTLKEIDFGSARKKKIIHKMKYE